MTVPANSAPIANPPAPPSSDPVIPAAGGSASPPPAAPPNDNSNALAEARAKIAKFDAAESKRTADAKKAADAKRVENDGAKTVLAERDAELVKLNARLASMEKVETDRADALFAQLSKESQAKLSKFKDKLDTPDWVQLIEMEGTSVIVTDPKAPAPPPTGSPMARKNAAQGYQPQQQTIDILNENQMGRGLEAIKDLVVRNNDPDSKGQPKFTMPVKNFYDKMKRGGTVSLNRLDEAKRRG